MSEAANGTAVESAEKNPEPQCNKVTEPDTTTVDKSIGDTTDKVADATEKIVEEDTKPDVDTKEETCEAGSAEATELEQKVIKQVEYYFGDMNLPRDRFLQEQIKLDDGWVPMEIMVKFNRLKQLCSDFKQICTALRKSNSGLLEVSQDDLRIRRSPDVKMPRFTEERKKELLARSIYAKGFPLESTLDGLMVFFESSGKMENVFMKKDIAKRFKGSVFAVFKDKDAADKFVKEQRTFHEVELKIEYKEDYYKRKGVEKKMRKVEEDKTRRDVQEQRIVSDKKKQQQSLPLGTILELKNFSKDTEREDLTNYFQDFGEIAWIDFDKGDQEARIRFKEAQEAVVVLQKAKEKGGGKIEINKIEQEALVLEGDEEMEHWNKIFRDQAERRDKKKRCGYNRKRGQQWGNRGPKSKRSRNTESKNDDSDEGLSDHDIDEESEPKGMM